MTSSQYLALLYFLKQVTWQEANLLQDKWRGQPIHQHWFEILDDINEVKKITNL